jgi:hypothetical protein
MPIKFRGRDIGAGPRLFPNDAIFPPKEDDATKILKKKIDVVAKKEKAKEPKLSKKEAMAAATKAAVSGAISELISDKPTKSKVREYMRARAAELS